ncbi:SET domain-containing protein 4 [Neocloeon triangulifer]|uniref:SET domain-containing protein 4 n=1 Tax=Neocloeon triangulifer TaxID=2078957 RepID=UPI00286F9F10|nr:SET domain-containing protein 4 [Neocloeon triangulifer]
MGRAFRIRQRKKRNQPPVNIIRDTEVEDLCKWMSVKNWTSTCSLRLFNFPNTGRGLQALCSISKGDVLVSIPKELIITCTSAIKSPLMDQIFKRSCSSSLFPIAQQILATFLLLEQRKEESEWRLYLQSIPKSFTTPHFATDLNKLPDYLSDKVKSEILRVKSSLDWANQELQRCKIEKFLWPEYRWAWFAVNTRAVFVKPSEDDKICRDKDNIALAPYLDLLNHSPNIRPNKVGWNGDFYHIVASESFKKHTQAFISYGAHDNFTLCLEYGFVVPGNPNDRVLLSEEEILKSLEPEKKINKVDGLMWCTREGLNWTALVFVSKCINLSAVNFAENEKVLRASEKVICCKIKNLELQIEKYLTEDLCESLCVVKELILEHLDLLKTALLATLTRN